MDYTFRFAILGAICSLFSTMIGHSVAFWKALGPANTLSEIAGGIVAGTLLAVIAGFLLDYVIPERHTKKAMWVFGLWIFVAAIKMATA